MEGRIRESSALLCAFMLGLLGNVKVSQSRVDGDESSMTANDFINTFAVPSPSFPPQRITPAFIDRTTPSPHFFTRLAMRNRIRVVALLAAGALAACAENPVDSPQTLKAAFGPKSVQATTAPAPLTLIDPEVYKPFQLFGPVDQAGYVSNDATADMGNDRPVHIKYWGGRLILQQKVAAVYYGKNPFTPTVPPWVRLERPPRTVRSSGFISAIWAGRRAGT